MVYLFFIFLVVIIWAWVYLNLALSKADTLSHKETFLSTMILNIICFALCIFCIYIIQIGVNYQQPITIQATNVQVDSTFISTTNHVDTIYTITYNKLIE